MDTLLIFFLILLFYVLRLLRLITIIDTMLYRSDYHPIELKSVVHKPAFRAFNQI